ncbi:MAG TPA: beta-propeller fold lactonase family protein [Actinotalea sp.]|nr:beta-propeller fold lactonase family protein [Actinotalea sp.]
MSAALWLGAYPAAGPDGPAGQGEGIWRLELDEATGGLVGTLAAPTAAPSFLALSADGRSLFAAGETAPGSVTRFDVRPDGGLVPRERVSCGGSAPCHLLMHPRGRALYVANYASGSVAVLPLEPGGPGEGPRLAGGVAQVFEHSGRGPRADRQEGPHAHMSLVAPGGRHLLVADLGTDELRSYDLGEDGRLRVAGVAHTFAPGTGPRHLAALGGDDAGRGARLVVLGELDAAVHLLSWDPDTGTAEELQVLPACVSPAVTGREAFPAHVVVHDDVVLVGVRGPDVLARFAVGDDGLLTHVADVPVGGSWPRHHAVLPGSGWVVVAAQGSDVVTTLRADPGASPDPSGRGPQPVVGRLAVPVPACVVLAPSPGRAP